MDSKKLMSSPSITIFAGISGIDKSDFVKKLLRKSRMTKKVLVINFEEELRNESRNPPETSPDMAAYLDSPDPTLKFSTFEGTFPWVAKLIACNKKKYEHVFLLMHLSYFKNSEFYPPFVPTLFDQLFTTLPSSEVKIITLIDDVFSTWKTISTREINGYFNTQLSLREILAWRSLESLRAESLKIHYTLGSEGGRRVSHYVISIRHPHSTFHNLLFKENAIRIYLSYPISESRKTQKGIMEINNFRKKMHSLGKNHGMVIFDPVAIDELCIKFALDKMLAKTPEKRKNEITNVTVTQNDRWPICLDDLIAPDIPLPVALPRNEIEEVVKDIGNQIASRDYTLVDASSYLTVYRPFYNKIPSKGAEKEIDRANDHMKRVLVYHPKEDYVNSVATAHPFGSRTKTYDLMKDFFEDLQRLIKQKKVKD